MKNLSSLSINKGFSLIEILVVVAIVTVIISALGINALASGQKSRDAKRQADLALLQNAIELYKSKYGQYPAACKGPDAWSGQQGTDFACSGGNNQYIAGLAPEFIPVLPQDKKLNGTNSGYIYRVNTNRTVYKVKAHRTVESETVTHLHKFKPCDIRVPHTTDGTGALNSGSRNIEVLGWCGRVFFDSGNLAPACRSNTDDWRVSYGVWGGIEPLLPSGTNSLTALSDVQKYQATRNTADVICR